MLNNHFHNNAIIIGGNAYGIISANLKKIIPLRGLFKIRAVINPIKNCKTIEVKVKKNVLYKDLKVIKAPENGQIVLRVEKIIPVNERGPFLLELEEKLKMIDQGITIWCEPVGDKSKLRQLRGVKINT